MHARNWTVFAVAFAVSTSALAACARDPNAQTPANASPYGTYTQPAGTYPQGTATYPQPAATYPAPAATYPYPAATATAPAAAAAGFIPCQSDATCGLHRCNLATQTCAFPCGGAQDCASGYACTMGLCVPGLK